MKMKNILFALKLLFFIIFVSACNRNKLKEQITYKTSYTYNSDTCDSATIVLEHNFFNRDSIIIKSVSYKNGNFYTADYNNRKHTLIKKCFSTDSLFLYKSISQLNKDRLETKTEFFDSSNNLTYSIRWQYKKNTDQLEKQTNIFSDASVQKLFYSYDKYSNLLHQSKITDQDSTVLELHQMTYNASGQIIHDTIYYPGTRKIVFNEYKNDMLFYTTEKFEYKSDTGSYYIPISQYYWKKYFLYDKKGALTEVRNIKMSQDSKTFRLVTKEKIKYSKNGMIEQQTFYNSENKKVYSMTMDYRY